MKKALIALLLVFTLLLCLTACKKADDTANKGKTDKDGESLADNLNLEDEGKKDTKKDTKDPETGKATKVDVVDPTVTVPGTTTQDPAQTANPGTTTQDPAQTANPGTTTQDPSYTVDPIAAITGDTVDYYGKINIYEVNVRSLPVTGDVSTTLRDGTKVHVTEERTGSDNNKWGKIDQGWVCLKYVDKIEETPEQPKENEPTGETDPVQTASSTKQTGVINIFEVNVRDEPSGNIVTTLRQGDKVTITETKVANTLTWGKIEGGGWVCMKYVDLDKAEN